MTKHSEKIKVNFIISRKSEIYLGGSTPCGERRLFDKTFWDTLKEKVEPNEINLFKPFNARSHFTQNIANVLYHFNNARTVKRQANPDAVSHIFFGEEAALLRLMKLQKTVVTCLDIIPLSFPEGLSPQYRLFYKLCVQGLKKADRILTVSDHTARDLVKFLNIDPKKIKTSYWGINDIFKTREVPYDFYLKYGLNPRNKHLLSVGAIDSARKNLGALVEIMPLLLKKNPDLTLIISGYKNDTTRDTVSKLIGKHMLENHVRLLTKISDEDLCLLYNLADVFVFPTLYEGFGLPPVEAMRCGTPVIASNNSSLPEAVGDAGILINPRDGDELADSIQKMLSDEKLRRAFIEKGFQHSRKFSWETHAREVYETYLDLNANS